MRVSYNFIKIYFCSYLLVQKKIKLIQERERERRKMYSEEYVSLVHVRRTDSLVLTNFKEDSETLFSRSECFLSAILWNFVHRKSCSIGIPLPKVATAENIRGIPNTASLPHRARRNEECDDEREELRLVIHCNSRKTGACIASFRRRERLEKDGESLCFTSRFNAILSKL